MRKKEKIPEYKPPQLDEFGNEVPDPTPLAMPAGFKRPETIAEQVRRLVRAERFQQAVNDAGYETFDEADDFDIEDDPMDPSPYETFFDPSLGREITPADLKDIKKREYYERLTTLREEARKRAEMALQPDRGPSATTVAPTGGNPAQAQN